MKQVAISRLFGSFSFFFCLNAYLVWRRVQLASPGTAFSARVVVLNEFSSWQRNLDESVVSEFKNFCRGLLAQGVSAIVVVAFDSSVGVTARTMLCSLEQASVLAEQVLCICFDADAVTLTREFNVTGLLWRSSRHLTALERYRVKLVVPLFAMGEGLDCFIVDSDVFFLGNFFSLWNDRWDLELASNAPSVVRVSDFEFGKHQANSGLVKYRCKASTVAFQRDVVGYAFTHPKLKDQEVLHHFLSKAVRKRFNWLVPGYGLAVRVLEPLQAPTGSALLCVGRSGLRELAKRCDVEKPVAVHLNWHVFVEAKLRTLRLLGWLINGSQCVPLTWPFWSVQELPEELVCSGPYIRLCDRLQRKPLSYMAEI